MRVDDGTHQSQRFLCRPGTVEGCRVHVELMTERFGINTDQGQNRRYELYCAMDTTCPYGDVIFSSAVEVASLGYVSQEDTERCLDSLLEEH